MFGMMDDDATSCGRYYFPQASMLSLQEKVKLDTKVLADGYNEKFYAPMRSPDTSEEQHFIRLCFLNAFWSMFTNCGIHHGNSTPSRHLGTYVRLNANFDSRASSAWNPICSSI